MRREHGGAPRVRANSSRRPACALSPSASTSSGTPRSRPPRARTRRRRRCGPGPGPSTTRPGALGHLGHDRHARGRVGAVVVGQAAAHLLEQPQVDGGLRGGGHGHLHVARAGARGRARGHRRRAGEAAPSRRPPPPRPRRTSSPLRCAARDRARARARRSGRRRRRRRAARDADLDHLHPPACSLPGATCRPSLEPWKVAVTAARTASPSTSPVEALTPEGTSQATTGASCALIAAIAEASGSRGTPSKPVPSSASTSAPEPSSRSGANGSGGAPGRRSRFARASPRRSSSGGGGEHVDLVPVLAQQARRHEAVSAVVALAHDDPDRARPRRRRGHAGEARARPLHQVERGHALLLDRPGVDRAHLGGLVERIEPVPHVQLLES